MSLQQELNALNEELDAYYRDTFLNGHSRDYYIYRDKLNLLTSVTSQPQSNQTTLSSEIVSELKKIYNNISLPHSLNLARYILIRNSIDSLNIFSNYTISQNNIELIRIGIPVRLPIPQFLHSGRPPEDILADVAATDARLPQSPSTSVVGGIPGVDQIDKCPQPLNPDSTGSSTTTASSYGVKLTYKNENFYLRLLPFMQSTNPTSSASEAPNSLPGLHIKIVPNLARLRIPGFAPVYQNLGIDSAIITFTGTFVPTDGSQETPPPDSSEFNSSYKAASRFYDFAVKTGGEISVTINVPEDISLRNNPLILNNKPGFKGIVKSMELFHRTHTRTWYTLQFEMSDFGMHSSSPLDMNYSIDEAIRTFSASETQARQETRAEQLTDLIGNREVVGFNNKDAENFYRSDNGYYYIRYADPKNCGRGLNPTNLECKDEVWIKVPDNTRQRMQEINTCFLKPNTINCLAELGAEQTTLQEATRARTDFGFELYNITNSGAYLKSNVELDTYTGAEIAETAISLAGCAASTAAAVGSTAGGAFATAATGGAASIPSWALMTITYSSLAASCLPVVGAASDLLFFEDKSNNTNILTTAATSIVGAGAGLTKITKVLKPPTSPSIATPSVPPAPTIPTP